MLPEIIYIDNTKYVREIKPSLPEGYSLYQYGDDFQTLGGARTCASGGCPAVMVLPDERTARPDTIFNKQWQFYVYAINKGMTQSSIIAIMGDGKALFNKTGFGGTRALNNYISGKMGETDPRLDKLRTFALATHALKPTSSGLLLLTMNGNLNPPLKPGRKYPNTLAEVNPDDYLYLPETHRWLFMDCTNVKWKADGTLGYGPWDTGIFRPWLNDNRKHTFFPLVSKYQNYCIPSEWNLVTNGFPSPFR